GDMEQEDDPRLLPALQPEQQHPRLDHQRPDHQKVIARHPAALRPPQKGAQDQRQHQPPEQTRPPLLQPEPQELIGVASEAGPIGPRLRPRHQTTAPGFERQAGGWSHGRTLAGAKADAMLDATQHTRATTPSTQDSRLSSTYS